MESANHRNDRNSEVPHMVTDIYHGICCPLQCQQLHYGNDSGANVIMPKSEEVGSRKALCIKSFCSHVFSLIVMPGF